MLVLIGDFHEKHTRIRFYEIVHNFRLEEKPTMVKSCVAANCSNTYGHGISLFKFPKDPELRQKWIREPERRGVAEVSTAFCVPSTSKAAALKLILSWQQRWAYRSVEG